MINAMCYKICTLLGKKLSANTVSIYFIVQKVFVLIYKGKLYTFSLVKTCYLYTVHALHLQLKFYFLIGILIYCLCLPHTLFAKVNHKELLDFSLFRIGTEGPVMLIVGGIQGDEPGGFSAATLVATRYTVENGTLWIVPNLNFPSIIKRKRGIHGDMNRKFAILPDTDPQYSTVSRIQKLICSSEVKLILNLHDGSGFYRPKYKDSLHGPARWGQSVIIDQDYMPNFDPQHKNYPHVNIDERMQFLGNLAEDVVKNVNKNLLHKDHYLTVRNTHTAQGDREMEKSLSWFAVRNKKPAFGLEASKEFSVVRRVYYHLHMIEAFAQLADIELKRDFPLTLQGVSEALYTGLSVSFVNNRVMLPLEDVRSHINYLPLPKEDYSPIASKPIMAVLPNGKNLYVHYGNRTLTTIRPDWHDIDNSLDTLKIIVDDKERVIHFGSIVPVAKSFQVLDIEGYRVNAIGANTGEANESNIKLQKNSFIKKFSVDNSGSIYRVEIYKDKSFCGMFLVRFSDAKNTSKK